MKRIRNIVRRFPDETTYRMERDTRRGTFVSVVHAHWSWERRRVAEELRFARRWLRARLLSVEVNGVPDEPY